jgi:hypothetical protein
VFVITGDSAEIRNGGIQALSINAAFAVSGAGAWLHHLSVDSDEREMTFGDGATISDSQILGRIVLARRSNLERNTLRATGGSAVASLTGNGNRLMDNRIFSANSSVLVLIAGDGNVVANNVMVGSHGDVGLGVDGDYNVLRGNTVLVPLGTILRIAGTGNTLDGNIAPPEDPDHPAGGSACVGIAARILAGHNRENPRRERRLAANSGPETGARRVSSTAEARSSGRADLGSVVRRTPDCSRS